MKTILIIDDDKLFGESLADSLSDANYNTTYIENPLSEKVSTISQKMDVALVDLRLKNISGLSLISDIKKLWPECHIIIMTGFGTISTAVNAIKLGASDYLTKPVTVKKIEYLLNKNKASLEDQGQDTPLSLERIEREYIEHILVQEKGNISRAAEKLGLHRQSLQRKLKKWVPFK